MTNKNAEPLVQKAGSNYPWRCENVFVFLSSVVSLFQLRMVLFICFLISLFWENRDTCYFSTGPQSSKGPEEETFMRPIKAPAGQDWRMQTAVCGEWRKTGAKRQRGGERGGRGEGCVDSYNPCGILISELKFCLWLMVTIVLYLRVTLKV